MLSKLAPPLQELIEQLKKLPGIGEKSATRLALHILHSGPENARKLADAIIGVVERIKLCSICFNLTDMDPCSICSDSERDAGTVCIVESPAELMAIENLGVYKGRYHVLHGLLNPVEGIGPEDLRIDKLVKRIKRENIEEVIFALSPSAEGEATIGYVSDLIKGLVPKITHIAYGVPLGADIKYSDKMTLERALLNRHSVEGS